MGGAEFGLEVRVGEVDDLAFVELELELLSGLGLQTRDLLVVAFERFRLRQFRHLRQPQLMSRYLLVMVVE